MDIVGSASAGNTTFGKLVKPPGWAILFGASATETIVGESLSTGKLFGAPSIVPSTETGGLAGGAADVLGDT